MLPQLRSCHRWKPPSAPLCQTAIGVPLRQTGIGSLGKNIPALRRGRASKWDEIGWQLLGNLIINVNRLSVTSLRSVLRDLGIGSKITSEDLPQVVLGELTCIHRKTIHKYKGMVEAGVKPVYTEEHVAIGTVESDQCETELPECLTEPTDVCLTEPTDVSREEELLNIEKI